jgi:hypothetical protein
LKHRREEKKRREKERQEKREEEEEGERREAVKFYSFYFSVISTIQLHRPDFLTNVKTTAVPISPDPPFIFKKFSKSISSLLFSSLLFSSLLFSSLLFSSLLFSSLLFSQLFSSLCPPIFNTFNYFKKFLGLVKLCCPLTAHNVFF